MAPDTVCPRCGEPLSQGTIHELCPSCLARSMDDLLGLADQDGPPDDILPGVPGYQLLGPLGIGGMGQVFAATASDTGTPAAIKILAPRWSCDEEAAARFRSEAEALTRLHHPHIVTLLGTGETHDGRLFIAMELITGSDLGQLLRAEKIPLERAWDIFLKTAAGLTHAHSCGIVHRDVKPSNILIGRDGTVKLSDFGLAKHLSDDPSHSGIGSLTQTRDTFGTPYYIAPEALRGRADLTPAADVYAAGVLLYHLVTGSPPLGNFTPLSAAAGLPRSIDTALLGAIQADPAKRSPDLSGLIHSVLAAQRGQARRRPFRVALATLAGLSLIASATFTGWRLGRPAPPPPPPVFPAPEAATTAQPWVNSLGMKFVPAGTAHLLVSIYETRRKDYESFVSADRSLIPAWRLSSQKLRRRLEKIEILTTAGWKESPATWQEPGFPQTPEDPASGIAHIDAEFFCEWLTVRERSEGRIQAPCYYRLPSDAEWSAAAPAPTLPGNLAGPEARISPWPDSWPVQQGADAFPRSAPTGSFPAAPSGLFDMNGNVSEWTSTQTGTRTMAASGSLPYLLRGTSWASPGPEEPPRSARQLRATADVGFRCVLDLDGPDGELPEEN